MASPPILMTLSSFFISQIRSLAFICQGTQNIYISTALNCSILALIAISSVLRSFLPMIPTISFKKNVPDHLSCGSHWLKKLFEMPFKSNTKLHATNSEWLLNTNLHRQLVDSLVYMIVTCLHISWWCENRQYCKFIQMEWNPRNCTCECGVRLSSGGQYAKAFEEIRKLRISELPISV